MSRWGGPPDSWILAGSTDEDGPGRDEWAESYRADTPPAQIAAEYACGDSVAAMVCDDATDDDAFTDALAEAYARFKGYANADEYLAAKAMSDFDWVAELYAEVCEDARRDAEEAAAESRADAWEAY